jgi:4-diphosphocytidyl-2C-methyl-D-erythritol kinase
MAIEIRTPAFAQSQEKKKALQPLCLFDILKFEKTEKRQIAIVGGKGFRFPTNAENPVYKTAARLHRRAPGKCGVRITIQKNSPPGKGLGSWASASAGALLALNRLWALGLSDAELAGIARGLDPSVGEILKIHSGLAKPKKSELGQWAIVVTPRLIEIDRDWIRKWASRGKLPFQTVAENRFPDLAMIRKSLAEAGWGRVRMGGMGPAILGFSEKGVGVAKIPKSIRSKLDFIWIGKACGASFKLLD